MNLASLSRTGGEFVATFSDGERSVTQRFIDNGNDSFSLCRFIIYMRIAICDLTGEEIELSDPKLTTAEVGLVNEFKARL